MQGFGSVMKAGRKLALLLAIAWGWTGSATAAPVPAEWHPVGPGGGGALYSPSFSPVGDELYVACDMGEIFHSTALGKSYETVNYRTLAGGTGVRVNFTSNPAVRYVVNGTDGGTPCKSTDSGKTWARLPGAKMGRVTKLFADPDRDDRVIVASARGLFCSSDGGATFKTAFTASGPGEGLYIGGAFFDGQRIFAGCNAGLLVSEDGGATFAHDKTATGIPENEEIVSFAGAKQGGVTRLYAVALPKGSASPANPVESLYGKVRENRVYVLDWGKGAWEPRTSGISNCRIIWVAMARGNIDTVWLGGLIDRKGIPAVYRTTNGGANWELAIHADRNQNIATGWEGDHGDTGFSWGGQITGFAVGPNDPNRCVFTNYGFIYLTIDGGKLWRQAYTSPADQNPAGDYTPKGKNYHSCGLEQTSCWHVTWADPQTVWASFTDIKGCRSDDAGASWNFDYTGHNENTSYNCVQDPKTGTLYIATSEIHDLYMSTYLTDDRIDRGSGAVKFSTDKGRTWQVLHDFKHPVVDVALDPSHPGTIVASVVHSKEGGIFRSIDVDKGTASTWTKLPSPPRTQGHPYVLAFLKDGTLVSSWSGRRGNDGNFTDSSGVFMLPPGADAWIDCTGKFMHYWTKDVVIDPHDPAQNTWYAAVAGGWNGPWDLNNAAGGLYKTTDRGKTWTLLFKAHAVGSCTVNPGDPNEMYVASEDAGLWHCGNVRDAKPEFKEVTNYPFRHPQRVFFNPFKKEEVWVTSFGNGIKIGKVGGIEK